MRPSPEEVCATVRRLIEYLRSLEGDDHERGLLAAQNIERTLARFTSEPESGVRIFSYDVGGKGMLDWIWSDQHRAQLEKFTDEIYRLIDDDHDFAA
jgi:hypothetical protein